MNQIKTNQRTFGKETKKMIKEKVKNAAYYKKAVDGNFLIKDKNDCTVATWHRPMNDYMNNGLLIIW